MSKRTIHEVVSEVLRSAGRPMSANEIFEEIKSRGLYQFNSKNPSGIVRSQLRRYCQGNNQPNASNVKYFRMNADGLFELLDGLK